MHLIIIASATLLATPAGAQEAPSAPVAVESEKKICKKFGETGSRVAKRKVCATQREWDESRRKAADYTRGMQTRAGQAGMPQGN